MIQSKPKKLVSEQGNHWRTPQYVFDVLHERGLLTKEYQDPFPWRWDGVIDGMNGKGGAWGENNFINPPYNDWRTKEEIVKLTLSIHDQGANCSMLMPFDFETIPCQKWLVPRLEKLQFGKDWFFWPGRIPFIGYKSSSKQFFNLPLDEKPEGWENETVIFKGKELKKYVKGCGLGGSVIYSFIHKKNNP
jgi:hypothetical protein